MLQNYVRRTSYSCVLLAACLLSSALPARAGDAEDIQQMLKSRQFSQALDRSDKFLTQNPKDAQVRFLRGITLTELNRPADAIKAFTSLAEDHPQLPEPYNNLAVLYAQQNQLDKARAALLMAIQTNPSYAIAHENLGDLYARLASQSYDKALQLEGSNSTIKTKLTLVRELFSRNTIAAAPVKAAPTVAPIAKAEPTKVEIKAEATSKPTTAASPFQTGTAAKPTIAPTVAKPTTAPTSAPKPANEGGNEALALSSAVQAWADAWSRRDVDRYLAAYDRSFATPKGMKFNAWAAERRERIQAPKSIEVRLSDIKVDLQDGNKAKVRFRQHYRSDRLSTSTGKTLMLRKVSGRWLITEERAG